jgi:group I intron endonuclease
MIIYKITNTVNGKIYIGQTKMLLSRRWAQHKCTKRTSPLYSSMKSHGVKNFIIEELCRAANTEELNKLEIEYIKKYDCVYPKGYNLSIGGYSNHGCVPWNKGRVNTEGENEKLSKAHTGNNMGINHYMYGKSHLEETKEKISKSKKGQRSSPDTEFKPGAPSAFKGRRHTPESLALVSKNGNRKEIQCIETGEIFPSMKVASEKLGIAKSYLFRLCYSGKKNIKLGLSFKFI